MLKLNGSAFRRPPCSDHRVFSAATSGAPGRRSRCTTSVTLAVTCGNVLKGIAWDAGYGIRSVDVSVDGGRSWQSAELGTDPGRFSFRAWQYVFKPANGKYTVSARASNGVGETQVEQLIFNPAGYNNNVVQRIGIEAV